MVRLLQLLALIFLGRLLWRALSQLLTGGESQRSPGRESKSNLIYGGKMVRDPVCGVYVPLDRSLEEREDGTVHYFCSDECRKRYRRKQVPVT